MTPDQRPTSNKVHRSWTGGEWRAAAAPGLGHLVRSAPEYNYCAHSCTPTTPSAGANTNKLTNNKNLKSLLFLDTFAKFAIAPLSNQDVVVGRSSTLPIQPRRRIISPLHSVDATLFSLPLFQTAGGHIRHALFGFKSTLKAKAMAQQCFDSRCIELLNSPISYKQTKKKTTTSKPVRSASVALIPSAPQIKAASSGGRPRPDAQPVSALVLSGSQTIHLPTTRESPASRHRLLLPPLQNRLFA